MTNISSKKGFTLAELMVAIGILATVVTIALSFLSMGMSTWKIGEAKASGQQQIRKSLQTLTHDLRLTNAGHVKILDSGTKLQLQVPVYSSATAEVKLDSSGSLVWGSENTQGEWICYKLVTPAGSVFPQLMRLVLNSSANETAPISQATIANNIQSITFIGLPATISPTAIQIIINSKNSGNQEFMFSTLKSRIFLRN